MLFDFKKAEITTAAAAAADNFENLSRTEEGLKRRHQKVASKQKKKRDTKERKRQTQTKEKERQKIKKKYEIELQKEITDDSLQIVCEKDRHRQK